MNRYRNRDKNSNRGRNIKIINVAKQKIWIPNNVYKWKLKKKFYLTDGDKKQKIW